MNVLFTSTLHTAFIDEDIALLRKHFHVDHLLTRGPGAPLVILRHLRTADVTFTWFASVYSAAVVALARLSGKRSVIVIGGVDASKEPEIGYGIWLSPWKAPLVRWAMRHAARLLVVDPFFTNEVRRLAAYDGANIEYVPTGYDPGRWTPEGPKELLVFTVAGCHDLARVRKKGLDLLFDAARSLPGIRFAVAGIHEGILPAVSDMAPPNVEILPFLPRENLLGWYRRAKVYCQPSWTEGLPNSLCEAMLCRCIPVGTAVGGIPTAVAGVGFLVPRGDARALAQALTAAMASDDAAADAARRHIAAAFTLERREASLVRILTECGA